MKTKLLLLTLLFSFTISAQIDFQPHVIVEAHPDMIGPYSIVAADIDGDGALDLVATSTIGGKIVWFKNLDGLGNFSAPIVITTAMNYPMALAIVDIDGDGALDIIAVSQDDHKIGWFKNTDGLGNFGALQPITSSLLHPQTLQAIDIDGDGALDIVVGGDYSVRWFKNLDGLGNFGPERILSTSIGVTESIVVGDIDGDGDIDVIVSDFAWDMVMWFENLDGQGTFSPERIIGNDAGVYSVIVADLDKDGDLDVLTTSSDDSIVWFENLDGSGNFSAVQTIAADPGFAHKLFAEDLNNNGHEDILATLWGVGKLIWIENQGSGNFGEPQTIYSDPSPVNIIAADFNGDGKMDVASGFYGSNKIIWLENKGNLNVAENVLNSFSIYPNPTEALLNVNAEFPVSEIHIYNKLGQILIHTENTNAVDVAALAKGIYLMKIIDKNGRNETLKFIKN